jgi:cysteine sulfinate desulfinase/cysteine desulfurase-like protein
VLKVCNCVSVDHTSVLQAMNVSHEDAVGTLRLSLGKGTSESDVDSAADILIAHARKQLVK